MDPWQKVRERIEMKRKLYCLVLIATPRAKKVPIMEDNAQKRFRGKKGKVKIAKKNCHEFPNK